MKVGKLTVTGFSHKADNGNLMWNVLCKCSKEVKIWSGHLMHGHRKSCGCMKHGMAHTPFYVRWHKMNLRCYNVKNKDFNRYGAKGITTSERWKDFVSFKEDMFDSFNKHVEKYGMSDTTIERLDNSKGYCIENVTWGTRLEQSRNRSISKNITYGGVTKHITEWAQDIGISYGALKQRLHKGWTLEEALNKEVLRRI